MHRALIDTSRALAAITLLTSIASGCGGGSGSGSSGGAGAGGDDQTGPKSLLSGIAAVSAGEVYACSLTKTGGALCWGYNAEGELGDGTATDSSLVPVAVSGLSSGVAAISAGGAQACALLTTGAVRCWGELSSVSTYWHYAPVPIDALSSGVSAISVGRGMTCALMSSGAVLCSDYEGFDPKPFVPVPGLPPDVAAITVGGYHACALTKGGAVLCWGNNGFGQLGNDSKVDSPAPVAVSGLGSGVAAISAGEWQTCALTGAGAVSCWGGNAAFDSPQTYSLVPVAVAGLGSGIRSISAGSEQTCAVTTAGAALCWGNDQYGELGNGTTNPSPAPTPVLGLSSGVAAISAGGFLTCALTTAGGVSCCGRNHWGGVGDGTTTDRSSPVAVVAP